MNIEQAIEIIDDLLGNLETYIPEEDVERDQQTPTVAELREAAFHASTQEQKDAVIKVLWARADIDARARAVADKYLTREWLYLLPGDDGNPCVEDLSKKDAQRMIKINEILMDMGINSALELGHRCKVADAIRALPKKKKGGAA